MTRQWMIAGAAGLVAAAMLGGSGPAGAQTRPVTFSSWGGTTQEAERKAYFESAAKELATTIREDTHNGYPTIRAHIESGSVSWDVIGSGMVDCARATANGLTQPLDYTKIDAAGLPPEFVRPNCVALWTFSYGITYRTDVFGTNGPKTWAEFWDVKKFPGRRSLWNNGRYLMEIALMADGVEPKDVYTVLRGAGGVDRAMKKLEEIKPNIAVWWTSQGQAVQLIKDKEVDLILIANGRIAALREAKAPIHFEFNQGLMDFEAFFVPRGAPNPAGAMLLINHSLKPEPQALFAKLISYGPTRPAAFQAGGIITPEIAAELPSSPQNLSRQAILSPEWYASREGEQAIARIARLLQ